MTNKNSGDAIIYGICAVVIATIAGATAVLLWGPEGTDVAPLVGMVAPTVAALAALAATQKVAGHVNRVDKRTEDLANGLMDSKIRAGVADVIPDHLLDQTYTRHQLAQDRVRAREGSRPSKDDPVT